MYPQCRYLLERIQTLLFWSKIFEEEASATDINPLVLSFLPASPHTLFLPLILQAYKDLFGVEGHFFGLNLSRWLKSPPSIPAYLEEWRQHWSWGVPEGIEAMSPPQSHPNKEHSSSQQGCICHVGSKDRGKGRFRLCHNYFSIQSQEEYALSQQEFPAVTHQGLAQQWTNMKSRKSFTTTLNRGKLNSEMPQMSTSAA